MYYITFYNEAYKNKVNLINKKIELIKIYNII